MKCFLTSTSSCGFYNEERKEEFQKKYLDKLEGEFKVNKKKRTITISSMKDFLRLIGTVGSCVIYGSDDDKALTIEIYDDYRE